MSQRRVGLMWRGDPRQPALESRALERLAPLREALSAVGVEPVGVSYSDDDASAMSGVTGCDGVLVWVDPLTNGESRELLNRRLAELVATGTWVSASPTTIDAIGTKKVLVDFQDLSWGVPCTLHETADSLADELREAMAQGETRVLKPLRGNGSANVWKVAPDRSSDAASRTDAVRVQDAGRRDDVIESMSLSDLVRAYAPSFAIGGAVVSQTYLDGLRRGMVRAYLVEDKVVGFATQVPSVDAPASGDPGTDPVFAMAAPKTMYHADEERFASVREDLEHRWVPEVMRRTSLTATDLPVIWDVDLLYRDESASSQAFALCEINVSCVTPFPDFAAGQIAARVSSRIPG